MTAASGKRSRAALRAFLAAEDGILADPAPADPRAAELEALGAEDPEALRTIREVFAGTSLPEDREKVRRLLRTRSEIQSGRMPGIPSSPSGGP